MLIDDRVWSKTHGALFPVATVDQIEWSLFQIAMSADPEAVAYVLKNRRADLCSREALADMVYVCRLFSNAPTAPERRR